MNLIVLAGGKSSRFGKDKAFIKFKGVPIIERVISTLEPLFDGVIVVTNHPRKYAKLGCQVVSDIYKNSGPLGGIHAGLSASDSMKNFVVACDMPLINPKLVKYLTGIKGYEAVVPKVRGFPEPLLAVYSKRCLPAIERMLQKKELKISRLYDRVKTKFVGESRIREFDPDLRSFSNINSLGEFRRLIHQTGNRL